MSLSFSFGECWQVAAVALIGQSLGAKDVEMAKNTEGSARISGG